MASIRRLKKTIQFISTELITDVYLQCIKKNSFETEKIEEIIMEISVLSKKFILRVNYTDGKRNPQIIKQYFKKFYLDWEEDVNKIRDKIANL